MYGGHDPNRTDLPIGFWMWVMVFPQLNQHIWVFPKIGIPQNGWFISENPIKMDDLGVPLFFGNNWKHPYGVTIRRYFVFAISWSPASWPFRPFHGWVFCLHNPNSSKNWENTTGGDKLSNQQTTEKKRTHSQVIQFVTFSSPIVGGHLTP